jgi:hypothetical protein
MSAQTSSSAAMSNFRDITFDTATVLGQRKINKLFELLGWVVFYDRRILVVCSVDV